MHYNAQAMFSDKNKKDDEEESIIDAEHIADDIELEEEEGNVAQKLKNVKEKLKTTEMEKAINLDGWQRERADFLNFKRRVSEDKVREREMATAKFIDTLLPFCDSFELALRSITENINTDEGTKNGLWGIATQLSELLAGYDVVTIAPPLGTPFNPVEHEALSIVSVEAEDEAHTVREVIQSGYKIGETVIRPARVVVGQLE